MATDHVLVDTSIFIEFFLMISLAHIFIAATAIEHNLHLATLNRSHFERITALEIISE